MKILTKAYNNTDWLNGTDLIIWNLDEQLIKEIKLKSTQLIEHFPNDFVEIRKYNMDFEVYSLTDVELPTVIVPSVCPSINANIASSSSSTPRVIVPFLIMIEFLSYIARYFSLGLRLFANMMAGHALMVILSKFFLGFFDKFTWLC